MHTFASTSLEYVRVPVSAEEAGAAEDVTTSPVAMAFVAEGADPPEAADASWKSASWETDAVSEPSVYYARCLVGAAPGVVALTPGLWDVYVKVTDNPELMIRKAETPVRVT